MADYFTAYQNALPQTSLADMMNLASSAQQYKQAQALNPLALQAKQLELQQAQAINPIELASKEEQFRQLMATNPDLAKRIAAEARTAGTQADVAAAIAPSTIAKAGSEAQTAAAGARSAELGTSLKFAQQGTNRAFEMLSDKNLTRQKVVDAVTAHMKNLPNVKPEDIQLAVNQIPNVDGEALKPHLIDYIRGNNEQLITALNSKYPAPTNVNLGGFVAPMAAGNMALTDQQPGAIVGQKTATSLAPTIVTDPITGQQKVFGGGGQPPSPAAAAPMPAAAPAAISSAAPIAGAFPAQPTKVSSQLAQGPNESPANFNARVAATQSAFAGAADQFNNPRSELGHIPTIQSINSNILKLLKDPNVDTGSVTDYLAGKTNLANLSAQQQELVKYLGQRVQNLTPRSDADTASKKAAYGALNMNKDALLNIVRQDNDWLEQQRLFSTGILKNGQNAQNPQNPNYGGVSNFTTNFTKFSSDPQFSKLMRYISLVGEGKTAKLDAGDKQEFSKLIGPLSANERQVLEQKRQQLLQFVNGGQ
jgi:hypothetical protein